MPSSTRATRALGSAGPDQERAPTKIDIPSALRHARMALRPCREHKIHSMRVPFCSLSAMYYLRRLKVHCMAFTKGQTAIVPTKKV